MIQFSFCHHCSYEMARLLWQQHRAGEFGGDVFGLGVFSPPLLKVPKQ